MKGPLSGLRVIDASMGAVGPWAGSLLGQLGADVIKLDSPQGDFILAVMPAMGGLSTTYISMNFNKRGITFDMKDAAQKKKIHELVRSADVFIENFRPGVADRIGLGYEELSGLNPRLVYASACGFGREGPMVKIGATDPHLQAFTGACSVNGVKGEARQRWRWYGHFDCTTAQTILSGILSALYVRDKTGKGKLVQITMIEASLALQRVRIAEHLAGSTPEPMGSATTYLVPDQAFKAKDRWLTISATSRREWGALCSVLDRENWRDDPDYARNPDRVRNRDKLIPQIKALIATRPAQYWLDLLRRAYVPCALFTSFDEFRYNTHYLENEMMQTFDTPHWGRITVGGLPWRFSRTPGEVRPGTPPGACTEQFADGHWSPPAPQP